MTTDAPDTPLSPIRRIGMNEEGSFFQVGEHSIFVSRHYDTEWIENAEGTRYIAKKPMPMRFDVSNACYGKPHPHLAGDGQPISEQDKESLKKYFESWQDDFKRAGQELKIS